MAKNVKSELASALRVLKVSGLVERDILSFIDKAITEKLERLTSDPKNEKAVKGEEYIKALVERVDRLDNEQLGKFVKGTLWSVKGYWWENEQASS